MDKEDFLKQLKSRSLQLWEEEKNAWANLGSVIGKREEVDRIVEQIMTGDAGGEEPPALYLPDAELIPLEDKKKDEG